MQLKKILNSNSGMVMILVLLVVIVIMTLSASILSTSLNQNLVTQAQVDAIKAEQLGKGYFWKDQSSGNFPSGTTPVPLQPVTIGETNTKQYTVVVTPDGSGKYSYEVQY